MDQRPSIKKPFVNRLWNDKAGTVWLAFIFGAIVIFVMLGSKTIWTQEWRWANIAHQMLIRQDFWHPYLGSKAYYDKPLLSYWFTIGFSFLMGKLSLWAIRLPDAIAGFISLLCVYRLGKILSNRRTGIIAVWMLITCAYFVMWTRTASSDMLNVAGILLALTWYFSRRAKPNFLTYFVLFIILALASLCKGLVAVAITFVALIPDLLYHNNWKKHLNVSFVIGLIIGIAIYLTPFILSIHFNSTHYSENGLKLVYQENFLRYFQAFDHKQAMYVYFYQLPLELLPWILFTIPALIAFPFRWRKLLPGQSWMLWSSLFVFAFLLLSGSRRHYYLLPLLPLVILFTADWVSALSEKGGFMYRFASYFSWVFYALVFLLFVVAIPLSNQSGGPVVFAKQVKQTASKIKPWNDWNIYIIGTNNNLTYYLRQNKTLMILRAGQQTKKKPSVDNVLTDFPILAKEDPNAILVIGKKYFEPIKNQIKGYDIIPMPKTLANRFHKQPKDVAIALIPKFKTLSATAKIKGKAPLVDMINS